MASSKKMSSFCLYAQLAIFFLTTLTSQAVAEEVFYSIDEEVDAGYFVGNLAVDLAIDPDSQFSMLTVPNETYFTLDTETGELTTTEHIDREVICPGSPLTCQFEVDIYVQKSTPLVINVKITVDDINDHAPQFIDDVTDFAIPESVAIGTRFPLSTATDEDTGINSIQGYRLSDDYSDIFGLIVNSFPDGSIVIQLEVLASLDREDTDNYQMHLHADDGGDPLLSGVTLLNITVLDSDDHSPQFERSTYSTSIAEDTAVGQEIIQVRALDPDTGTNGQIIYSFGGSVSDKIRELFDIDSDSGWLMVKSPLDYEDEESHQVTVQATNNVPNPVPDFATVTINIIDVNDNRPQLSVSPIGGGFGRVTHIFENTGAGQPVAFVRVSDEDSGDNGLATLTLEDHEGHFSIERISDDGSQYFLKTAVDLDREDVDRYNITILALDGGSPILTSRKRFGVIVDDENDNAPRFSSSVYHATISENNTPGHRVATVQAIDDDELENGEVVYSLLDDFEGSFAINPFSGVLSANKSLDRETDQSIELTVEACDFGESPQCSTAALTVRVLDLNDNDPAFRVDDTGFIGLTILENQPPGSYVGRAVAEDDDEGNNGRLTYSIITDSLFRIDAEDGRIYSEAVLDRETQELYHFTVQAVDNGLSPKTATTTVVVTVTDVNDHDPTFIAPSLNDDIRFIPVTAEPGFQILKVETEDMDKDNNAAVSYAISDGNTHGVFGIQANGNVVTAQELQFSLEGVHELVIRATDGGNPSRSATGTLRIVIADKAFQTSHSAAAFLDRFNLTIEHYLAAGNTASSTRGILDDWPMIVIFSLAGSAVILVIVFLFVAARCRTKNREQGKYIVPSGEELFPVRNGAKPGDGGSGKASDTDSGLASVGSTLSAIPSKNIRKWRAQQERDQDSVGSSQRGSTTNLGNMPPGITGATSSDMRLGNRQMSTFGSNSDLHSDSLASIASARRTPDPDAEVQRLLRKLRRDSDTVSERNSEGNGSGTSYDSGHGGDRELETTRTPGVWTQNKPSASTNADGGSSAKSRSSSYPRIAALAAQNVNASPMHTPSNGHRNSYMASPHCTPECLTLGHSDECWMPNPSSITKSKTVHFSKYDDNRSSGGSYRSYQGNDRPPATSPKPPNPSIAFGNVAKVTQNHKPLPKGSPGGPVQQPPANGRDLNGYYSNNSPAMLDEEHNGNGMPLTPIKEHPSERKHSQDRLTSTPSVIVTMHSPNRYKNSKDAIQNGDVKHRNDINRTDLKQQARMHVNGVSPVHRKTNGIHNGSLHNGGHNGVHNGVHNGRSDSRNSSGDSHNSSTDSMPYSTSSAASSEMAPVRYSPDEVEAVLEKCGGEVPSGVTPDGDRMYTDWV